MAIAQVQLMRLENDHAAELMNLATATFDELAKERVHHTQRQQELMTVAAGLVDTIQADQQNHRKVTKELTRILTVAVSTATMMRTTEQLQEAMANAKEPTWHDPARLTPHDARPVIVQLKNGRYMLASLGTNLGGVRQWYAEPKGHWPMSFGEVTKWAEIPAPDGVNTPRRPCDAH